MLYELSGVTLEHPSAGVVVARGLDLDVEEGEWLVLTGPSGSGKSTVVNTMAGFVTPSVGRVTYRGRDLRAMTPLQAAQYRNRDIGMIHQSFNLIPDLDATFNVMMPLLIRGTGLAEAHRAAQQALARLGLEHRSKHLPAQMSGGEQQRVAIGRALVAEPSVLLADEPTGNLDAGATAEFLALLDGVHRDAKVTIVLVTHDSQVASAGTRRLDVTSSAGWLTGAMA